MTSNAPAVQSKPIHSLVRDMAPQIRSLLPDEARVQRFTRTIMTQLSRNPDLRQCTPESFLGAMMISAQLGLEPGPEDHVWIIPRRNKHAGNRQEATFMVGYRGYQILAERAGWDIVADVIYSEDDFAYQLQPEPTIRHTPGWPTRGNIIGAYAVANPTRTDDQRQPRVVVLDHDELQKRRAAAQTTAVWDRWYHQMARKSAVRAIWRLIPYQHQSPELRAAQRHDDGDVITIEDVTSTPELDRPDMASEQQIAEIRRLAQTAGMIVPDNDGVADTAALVAELSDRHDVDDPADLTTEQADRFLEYLTTQQPGDGR